MVMLSSSWAELMEPGLRTIFNRHTKKKPDYLKTIFNVERSTKQVETNLGTGNLGNMVEWTSSGSAVSYADLAKGHKKQYTHSKYSLGLKIERELVEDDQYSEIRKRTEALSLSVWYTRQVHAASVFNNAFSGAYLGADSKPLCSATHPVAPGSGTNYDNADTVVLNAANLETARTNMKGWKDDGGNLLAVNPTLLIVPSALRKTALVIADSDKEPDMADNNVNVWKGSVRVIEWDFLTSTTAWFLVDEDRMKRFLNWYDRRLPVLERDKEDFDSEVAKWKTVGRWSYGWDDWSFCYGSTGTG